MMFVLFSGHNDRAVVALCRFFDAKEVDFVIIASSQADAIIRTAWGSKVIFTRLDKKLDVELFKQIQLASNINKLIYCPTTEFMNQFVLENREELEQIGYVINLPSKSIYLDITSKFKSALVVENILGIKAPPNLNWDDLTVPCVFKPNYNVENGKVLYPILCFSEIEASRESNRLTRSNWTIQKYIKGQSYYLCGYLTKDCQYEYFWQLNLMQQPNGKSIVLAKSTENPGINVEQFFKGLSRVGYFGLLMMELIIDENSNIYYIEINPRFWGPLQLTLDTNPKILELFVSDCGIDIKSSPLPDKKDYWYSWSHGAKDPNCKHYPLLADYGDDEIKKLIEANDLYLKKDTLKLHNNR